MDAKELRMRLLALSEKAEQEGRAFTADELTEVRQLQEQLAGLDAVAKVKGQVEGLEGDSRDATHPTARKSVGELFVEDPAVQAWLKGFGANGRIPDGVRVFNSPAVQVGSLFKRFRSGAKELITGSDDESAGAFVQTDYTGIYEPLGRIPLVIRNLISTRTTGSDLVEYVAQTVQVQEAAPVAEANVTEYTGATGQVSGAKPEGRSRWEKRQTGVKTLAVWIPSTKRALADAGQIRGLINQELRDDLDEALEYQILNGDGVGENLLGIANTPGILVQAFDTDLLRTTRQALTTLQVTGRSSPTAWVFNPADWEEVDLLQDNEGRYYWGGPLMQGVPRLWNVPVVLSQQKTQGTAYLADWRKAIYWDRESTTISVSDSHEDFFIRNMVAILAELRGAFGLIRPSAFVEVDLSAS